MRLPPAVIVAVTVRRPAPGSFSASVIAVPFTTGLAMVNTTTLIGGGKRIAYDSAGATLRAAATKRLTLTPGAKAKAALKRLKSAKVTLTVTFTPTGGKLQRHTLTATVRGGRR